MVRNFSLCDADGELSLLSGKHEAKAKKTVIAVSPAIADKLKHVMSSDESDTTSESINDRLPSEGKASGASNVEQNLDKAKDLESKSTKESKMNEEELKKLQDELSSLKDELATAKTKVTDLEKEVQAKDSQIERLTTDAQEMQGKMSKTLAMSLASMRTRFGKAIPKGEDGKDMSVDEYVTKLSERSVESLQDSLADLMFEIDQLPVDKTENKVDSADKIVKGDKVSDPVIKDKGASPKKKEESTPKRAIDRLSEGLNLSRG